MITKNETNLTEKQIAAVFSIISIMECNGLDTQDITNVAGALKVFGCSYKDFLWVIKHPDYALVCLEKHLKEIQKQVNNEARDMLKEQDNIREDTCQDKDKSLN